jgi:hypothetical protein
MYTRNLPLLELSLYICICPVRLSTNQLPHLVAEYICRPHSTRPTSVTRHGASFIITETVSESYA